MTESARKLNDSANHFCDNSPPGGFMGSPFTKSRQSLGDMFPETPSEFVKHGTPGSQWSINSSMETNSSTNSVVRTVDRMMDEATLNDSSVLFSPLSQFPLMSPL